jgi:hypothetical protein
MQTGRYLSFVSLLLIAFLLCVPVGCGDDSTVGNSPVVTTTTTTLPPGTMTFAVTVGITNDAGLISAIQFDLASLVTGSWETAGSKVNCRTEVPVNLSTCNDKGSGRATCALVELGGFVTPTAIMTCRYRSTDTIEIEDFTVELVDASDPDLGEVPDIDLAVTRVVMQ